MLNNMSFIDRTRYAVMLILTKQYNIPEEKAKEMVINSSFNEFLSKDPEFIGHRSATYWAKDILDEYDIVH
jgi:hypothetical protein